MHNIVHFGLDINLWKQKLILVFKSKRDTLFLTFAFSYLMFCFGPSARPRSQQKVARTSRFLQPILTSQLCPRVLRINTSKKTFLARRRLTLTQVSKSTPTVQQMINNSIEIRINCNYVKFISIFQLSQSNFWLPLFFT